MRKIQDFVLKGEQIFVGLEDSKKTWKACVRSERIVVNEASMPAEYENLRNYFRNKFSACEIRVMYEAGFRGFELHDLLDEDGWECVVTPPHTVTQEKCGKKAIVAVARKPALRLRAILLSGETYQVGLIECAKA